MKEVCKNCEYFCEVRKWPTFEEVLAHICVHFLVTEKADYILETKEYDICECWRERKDNGKE